jgi:non-haem Fe2+, alpha-ketoglutarate-dependent halogenase
MNGKADRGVMEIPNSTNWPSGEVAFRDAYRANGYFFPLRAVSEHEAAAYRGKLEEHEAATGGPLRREFRQKSHLLFTWLAGLTRKPAILDAVEQLLGPDLLVWQTAFFIKEAHDPGMVTWHQDSTYWGLSEPEVVTAWVALSPSTPDSGCVRVMPGTHRSDQVSHVESANPNNLLTRGQEIAVEVDESQAVSMLLRPGEMSLHHIRTFHNSEPNRSNDRRIGFAIRYIPTRIRQTSFDGDTATLVRGADRFGHFELEPAPRSDLAPDAVRYHTDVTSRRSRMYGHASPAAGERGGPSAAQ